MDSKYPSHVSFTIQATILSLETIDTDTKKGFLERLESARLDYGEVSLTNYQTESRGFLEMEEVKTNVLFWVPWTR